MLKVHVLKILLSAITFMAGLDNVQGLSAEANESLSEALPGVDLEKRRERLKNLGRLYSKKYNVTTVRQTLTPEGGYGNATEETSELETEEISTDASSSPEPSLEVINEKEGIAEYLFDGDINLTEKQLDMIEATLNGNNNGSRRKRQMDVVSPRWANNRLYYEFGARYRQIVKQALDYISARTCLTFTQSSTAANRVKVVSGNGCWSSVGMVGGVQQLSLGKGCDQIGTAAHEFIHALGSWHMHSRTDRDDYIIVDLTNVPESRWGDFAKINGDYTNNYTPYEYGSVMHYAANLFTTKGYSLKPRLGRYLQTEGTRVISYFDIKMLNDHYGCHARCATNGCFNAGEPRPKNCAVCNCPEGYGGAKCNERPAGCGEILVATAAWKTKTFTFGNAAVKTQRDNYMRCNHWIRGPSNRQIQVRVTSMKNVQCGVGCRVNSIELKTLPNKRMTNPRICCPVMLNQVVTSYLNPTPVISYNRYLTSTFSFQYRYV
uniref:Zinc metalloproteinase n=1 Tax=Haemonchus contortus TaxID=6289 RepID=A0A7I4YGY8_HAECO